MSNKSPKYPVEPTEDDAPASESRRSDPPPSYGAPAFRHPHEVRKPLAGGDSAYARAYPHFDKPPRRRGPARRVW